MKNIAKEFNDKMTEESYKTVIRDDFDLMKAMYFPNMLYFHIRSAGKKYKCKDIMDFGAGGGIYSVPLAYRDFNVDALDSSEKVLKNLKRFKEDIEFRSGKTLPLKIYHDDIMDFNPRKKYDMIFSIGVMEHYLDPEQRLSIIKKQSSLLKKGGIIITAVPSGVHPWREKMKTEKLGGYRVAEIDYSGSLLRKDFSSHGLCCRRIYGFNLLGFMLYLPKNRFLRNLLIPIYYLSRIFINSFTEEFRYKYSYSLICVAEKVK